MEPKRRKKKKRKKKVVEPIISVNEARANILAQQYAENCRARELLKKEGEAIREELQELIQFQTGVPDKIIVDIVGEKWMVKLVTKRADSVDMGAVIRRIAQGVMRIGGINKRDRIKTSKHIAQQLVDLMRKDGIMITKLRNEPWGSKYITDKDVQPYLYVSEYVDLEIK